MNLYINKRLRIEQDKVVIVKRTLPGRGKITVAVGNEVTPEEIIARASVSAGFRVINLAKALSVDPKDALQYLSRPIGQKIYLGELLAFKKGGLLEDQKLVLAPSEGVLSSYDNKSGDLKIEFLKNEADFAASVFGIVEHVDNLRGEVLIKTQATIIYGLMGAGKERGGLLKFLNSRHSLIAKESIGEEFTGSIIVGGGLLYESALMKAVSIGVHGIITGGINAMDFKGVSSGGDVGFSLLVTEGFGSVPIGEDIYKTLLGHTNKFAILDPTGHKLILPLGESNVMSRLRRTQVPREPGNQIEPEAITLTKKAFVRVISTPYLGEQGTIVAIDKEPSKLPSGIVTYLVTIETKTRKIKVPFTNIEAI